MKSVLIVGCGYVGQRVVRRLLDEGWEVSGLVRSHRSAKLLAGLGAVPIVADLDDLSSTASLPVANQALFYFVPPPVTGDSDPRLRKFLATACTKDLPTRIVYISTSGVYGDCHGEWIDESQPLKPTSLRAQRRADAESALYDWSRETGCPAVTLRVPGIYGPGRLPLERVRAGLHLLREADSPYTNRIHVDDLASACVAAMTRGKPGAVYNVSDGHPSNMTDYFNQIADYARLPRPPTVARDEADAVLTPGMRSFMDESKRLVNRRMREELGVKLRYPNLRAGLPSCFE
jgi:nucleoside-diphosphate-sugar epimerase